MKLIFSIFMISSMAFSHLMMRDPRQNDNSFEAEGRLVLFQLRPGDHFMRLYLVGKEAAKVNFSQDSKLINVTLFQKGKRQSVPFKSKDYYYQLEVVPQSGPYELEMEAEVSGQPDKVKLRMTKP